MWWQDFYPRSKPRQAKGGIKAQSKRGAFGQTWWGKRWIEVLESFYIGGRLQRGRSYARGGQVLSIDIDKGVVHSRVQGSRPSPYKVTIKLKTLSSEEWKRLIKALSEQAIFAAKLLGGEMPQDLEKVFLEENLSLFPKKQGDLQTECSCPDYSNPCKHIAAVYYLLSEEFDRDPYLLFKLRGLNREELLKQLGDRGAKKPVKKPAGKETVATGVGEPLPVDAARFWSGSELAQDFFGEIGTVPVHAALVKRLGSFPFWRGEQRFLDVVEPIYQLASQRGLETFAGSPNFSSTK